MSLIPNYVPTPYKTVSIKLMVNDAEAALNFYNQAFGAETTMVLKSSEGKVVHAEFRFADTFIMLGEEEGLKQPSSVVIQVYTPDVEGIFEEALRAGAQMISPIARQYYGDRAGRIRDPYGHEWILATHEEDLTPQEMEKRFHELYP